MRRRRWPRASRSFRRPGRRMAASWPTSPSKRRSRWSMCMTWPPAGAMSPPTSRAPTRRRPGRRMASKLAVVLTKDGSSQLYIGQCRRQRRHPPGQLVAASTPSRSSRPTASGSTSPPTAAAARRSTASAPAAAMPERVTFDGSYNVTPRLSPDGKNLAYVSPRRRPLPVDRDGSRHQADPDPDRFGQGRIAQLRPQRPHDPLRHRDRRPWRAGGGFGRWPGQTETCPCRPPMCANRPGAPFRK